MAQGRASQIVGIIASVLPPTRIIELARSLGVVKRQRRVNVVHLVQALVLGFGMDRVRSLSGLRRAYQLVAGETLARSSFHDRFTAELVELMRQLTAEALDTTRAAKETLRKAFKPFAEVLAIDSCIVRLHAGLAKHYPSILTHHTPASAKLTMVCNVVGRGPRTLQVNPGSTHDVHLLEPGSWVRGKLLIFDLGFSRAMLFRSVAEHGGYFLCRLKKQGNPTIIKSHRPEHAHLVGKKLRDHQDAIAEDVIDIEGEVSYVLRRKRHKHCTAQFRIVAVYNHKLELWHRYITNAPPEMMPAENITAIYSGRWEIELLFRELKSAYRIHQMPSGNRHATETLLYSAILTLLVSRKLHRLVRTVARLNLARLPFDRWARILAQVTVELLSLLAARNTARHRHRALLAFLCREAPDPNRSRSLLQERAQSGVMAFA